MDKPTKKPRRVGVILFVLLVAAVAIGLWKVGTVPSWQLVAVVRRPERMMGTTCMLAAVVQRRDSDHGKEALREAETLLRSIESHMSAWIDDSEISQLNRAAAASPVSLSDDTLEVLRLAKQAHGETGGVFDVTCRPLVVLWRKAADNNRFPTPNQIEAARRASSWTELHIAESSAAKRLATTSVDLGGIAKGYAIDRAIAVLRDARLEGGLVDIGGDVACFGRPPRGRTWRIDVQDPFQRQRLTTLCLSEGAVCTSGDYARYRLIGGRRYSHIIDPRTGSPAQAAPSATIVAPDAVTADIWATALSVLGREGIELLPDHVEAILIVGTATRHQIYCTPGILDLFDRPLPIEPVVVQKEVIVPVAAGD